MSKEGGVSQLQRLKDKLIADYDFSAEELDDLTLDDVVAIYLAATDSGVPDDEAEGHAASGFQAPPSVRSNLRPDSDLARVLRPAGSVESMGLSVKVQAMIAGLIVLGFVIFFVVKQKNDEANARDMVNCVVHPYTCDGTELDP